MMTEEKIINPFSIKNDTVFKVVFGRDNEICRYLLTDLLNSILDLKSKQKIQKLIYKNPFNLQNIPSDKLSVMDIKVQTEEGEWIDIEMQVASEKAFRKRSLYYWASLYKESLEAAQAFNKLEKCIVINILNYNCIQESTNYHTRFQVLEKEEHFTLTEDLDIHFIQLGKFDDTKPIENMTDIEQWVTFFKDSDNEDKVSLIETVSRRKESIRMATEVLSEIKADEQMREMILSIEKARRDQISRESNAREEGIEKGIQQVAMNLLRKGYSKDEIIESTGLTAEDLDLLKKNQ